MMKMARLALVALVTVSSFSIALGYETPICRAHEGSVYSFCNGSPFRAWGVGAEGVEQAIKNCQWKANSQKCLREATVSVDPFTNRSIGEGSSATIDRKQWFGGHWNIYKGGIQWRDEDIDLFHGKYHAHPGRSFYVSYRMSVCAEDPARPGFVDVPSLLSSCANALQQTPAWPLEAVDMIVSSKPDQLYNNSCGHRNGQPPKGFMPGSHAAAAEFFALYYKHCMPPTAQNRVFMEVSNECDVKTGPTGCDSPWSEMIALHAAVGDAIHTMYQNITTTAQPRARPLVCGPTEAFPEYQLNDFRTWRDGGQLAEFLEGTVTNSSIDCLSTHIYSTYQFTPNTTGRDSVTDPFSSHYVAREVNNVDAILDMQEASLTEASGAPAAILISEYGAAFKDKLLYYHPAHDFWILRAVNIKLMTFLERPDRILKALPFIVDKATWHAQGMKNNASQSYPQAMWRNVNNEWQLTHLHKFYGAWRDFGGERFDVRSDNAHIQVHAAARRTAERAGISAHANWTVAVNNANHLVPARVNLSWPPLPTGAAVVGVSVRRLAWNADEQIPTLTDTDHQPVLPATLELAPAELVFVTVRVEVATIGLLAPTTHINTRTFPSPQRLIALPSTAAAANAVPFRFLGALAGGALPRSVRVSLGGDGTNRAAILATLNIVVNGVACTVDPTLHAGGQQHLSPKWGSFFGGIEVPVPATAVTRGPRPGLDAIVKVWSGAVTATDDLVVSTVALLVETSNATGVATPTQTTTTTTPIPTTTRMLTSTSVASSTTRPATPSISTIAPRATTQASKGSAEEALVVSPSPEEQSNSAFLEIVVGAILIALCLIFGCCCLRAVRASSNNSAETPTFMQQKNMNSWRVRTKKNTLAVAYMEQIDSGTSKGDKEIQMNMNRLYRD